MRSSIALLAASALDALAQDSTSTTSLFLGGPSAPGQSYAGSVISVGPSDTTYAIMCTATAACGTLSFAQTITLGPSNLNFEFATTLSGIEASASETCQMSGTDSASCDIAFTLEAGPTQTALTTSLILTGNQYALVPVEITGGVEKLAAATSGASGSGTATTGAASESAAASETATASESAASASGSDSGASSIMANGKGGDVLALVMFSAITVSVGALMIL